jgi:hypothetical protein
MPEKHPLYDKYGRADEKQNIPAIHLSPAVEHASEKARQAGRNIPNEPGPKIETWMSELEGYLEQIKSSEESYEGFKDLAHKAYITGTDDVSVMKKIEMDARRYEDEGRGMADDILQKVNSELVEKYREQIRADQQESLDKWIDYLSSDGAKYPMWFKYYTFRNIVKLSDKVINNKFQDRSPGTFNRFPKVNYEALALVFETMANHYSLNRTEASNSDTQLDSDTKKHLRGDANFTKLYKQAIDEVKLRTKETLNTTAGEWIKYDMVGGHNDYNDDYDAEGISKQAYDLSGSTGGTGWCIGDSPGMAQRYLEGGDFYVYYTKDSSGEYTAPRLAIGMNGTGESAKFTAEVRGVQDGTDGDQGVEPEFLDILKSKMHEINPEDAKYYDKKIENMQRLTDVYARFKDNQELTEEDLVFIYQIEDDIVSFAQGGSDPRLKAILEYRDFNEDLQYIYGKTEPTEIVQAMLEHGDYWFLAVNVDFFDTLDHNQIAQQLLAAGEGWAVVEHLNNFQGLDHNQIAQQLLAAGEGYAVAENLYKFQGLDNTTAQQLLAAGQGSAVALYPNNFQGLDNTTAQEFIAAGRGFTVARNLNNFQGLDHNQIAQQLLAAGEGENVALYLNNFQGLDNTTAQELIAAGRGFTVSHNLDKFQGLSKETMEKLKPYL